MWNAWIIWNIFDQKLPTQKSLYNWGLKRSPCTAFSRPGFFILTKHRLLIGSFFGYICVMLQLSGYLHHSVLSYKIIHSWIFHWPKQPKIDMSKWCCTPYIRFHLILLICTSYNLGYDITWYCLIRLNDYNLTRQTAQRLFCKFVFYPTGNTSTIEI